MIRYFIDPLLRGPTLGSMLMCFAASLMGVFLFVRRRSLLGETLSHATYPGVIFGIIVAATLDAEKWMPLFILAGGTISASLGILALHFLKKRLKLRNDAALTATLAAFFGFGVLMASHVQSIFPSHFRSATTYLYGQAATMQDSHIVIYGAVTAVVVALIIIFYKELQVLCFDAQFAESYGSAIKSIDALFLTLVVLSTVIGIRSVGVVLMSAMLIAPAVAARQYTNHLKTMLYLSGVIGLLGAFSGSVLSFELSKFYSIELQQRLSFPTGPLIVMIVSIFAFTSLLFAPKRGLFMRFYRIMAFKFTSLEENLLKSLWRKEGTFTELRTLNAFSTFALFFILARLQLLGWIIKKASVYALTEKGRLRGDRIVRLHRLWEVYLVDYLGLGVERVHRSAEEMEHILTPEIEKELTELLKNPQHDPHHQPIPLFQAGHVPLF